MCDFYCFVSVEIKMSNWLKSTSFKVPYLLVFQVIMVYKNPPRGDRVHVLCVCDCVYLYTVMEVIML